MKKSIKKKIKPNNIPNRRRDKYKLGNGKNILKEGLNLKWSPKLKTQIRTRTILSSNLLIRLKKLDRSKSDKCILCDSLEGDNIEHWVFNCTEVIIERHELLGLLIRILRATEKEGTWKNYVISYILGDCLAPNIPKNILKKEITKINNFFGILANKRFNKIKNILNNRKE